MTASDLFRKTAARLLNSKSRLAAAVRANRRFAAVTALILFFTVDAMGVYALSRPAGVELPHPKVLGFGGCGNFYGSICYNGRMYYAYQELPKETTATLKGWRLGKASGIYGMLTTAQLRKSKKIYSDMNIEVYTARGYGTGFRLLGVFPKAQGDAYGALFTCETGITARTGADLMERRGLRSSVKLVSSIRYEPTDDGNNTVKKASKVNTILYNRFINALFCAAPEMPNDQLDKLLGQHPEQKKLEVTTTDGVVNHLTLFEGGYVWLDEAIMFMKMSPWAFDEFWNTLQY